MPNEILAKEWLTKAWHDLSSARILFDVDHFTDSIAIDLQQAIEKTLKSIMAYNNEAIKKTHNLLELSELVSGQIDFDQNQINILGLATLYYTQDRYPTSNTELPLRDEVKAMLGFAEQLFSKVCRLLQIDAEALKQ